ncbi:MAG TPA: hypothetical protein VLT33_41345, partial [Labilithrix sp.]|nr:hypothetical protein [Labilithrix sp.]
AYRRTLGVGADRQAVDVFLNFSRREIALDLAAHVGRTLFSNRSGERHDAPAAYVAGPCEAVIVFDAR